MIVVAAQAVRDVDLLTLSRGVRHVDVDGDLVLSADTADTTLAFVLLLRHAASLGLPVAWRGRVEGFDPGLLVHLAPPQPSTSEDGAITRWRQEHRPGLCYYRQGPDFVLVKDVRAARARFALTDPDDVVAFGVLEEIVPVAQLSAGATNLLAEFERERLALRLGDRVTILPYRMRRWPVPALEI